MERHTPSTGYHRLRFLSLTVIIAFALSTPHAFASAQTAEEQKAAQETYIPNLRLYPATPALAERGVAIAYVEQDTSPGNGRYFCGALDQGRIAKATAIADSSLQKIPAAYWKNIHLKYLLLCSEAKSGGRVIGGIPVPPLRLLMLSTGQAVASNFSYTILHELYHLLEISHGGLQDAAWDRSYTGYDNSYGAAAGDTRLGSGGPGFVNGYGKSFAHEERAEIFAIHGNDGQALRQFAARKNDTVLQSKIDTMLKRCAELLGGEC